MAQFPHQALLMAIPFSCPLTPALLDPFFVLVLHFHLYWLGFGILWHTEVMHFLWLCPVLLTFLLGLASKLNLLALNTTFKRYQLPFPVCGNFSSIGKCTSSLQVTLDVWALIAIRFAQHVGACLFGLVGLCVSPGNFLFLQQFRQTCPLMMGGGGGKCAKCILVANSEPEKCCHYTKSFVFPLSPPGCFISS